MKLIVTCCYCKRVIQIKIPRKYVDKSNPNYKDGYSCNNCISKDSPARNGIDEAIFTEEK